MSRLRIGAAALMVGFAMSQAGAADFGSTYVTATPYAAYNWNGAYVGANAGYQWGTTTNFPTNPSGVIGGVQAGYNWQSGQFVIGGETDLQLSAANDTFAAYQFSNPWFGTTRLRAGWAINNILLYATAGLAYGTGNINFMGLSEQHTTLGWTAGAGIEIGFTPNWSAKAEFLYVDLSEHGYLLTGVPNGLQSNIVRVGVNYHF